MTKLLHFVNLSQVTLYIALLRTAEPRLEIHVHLEPGDNRLELKPMQRLPVDAITDVNDCTVHNKFHYAIYGHCSGIEIMLPETTKPDGPTFKFFNQTSS